MFSLLLTLWNLFEPIRYAAIYQIACWLLFPIALHVFPKLRSRREAALVHALLGVVLSIIIYQFNTLILVAAIIISYFAISLRPIPAAGVALGISSFGHLLFQLYYSGWAMDVSGNLMCIAQKVISVSWNLEDGRQKASGNKLKRKRWDDVALLEKPSFLDFFAYTITPYSSFGNPFIEFKVFLYALDCGLRPPLSEEDRKFAWSRYLWSFFHAVVQFWALNWTDESIYSAPFYTTSSVLFRTILMMIFSHLQLGRYIPSWYALEGSLVALGLYSNDIIPGEECLNLDYTYVMSAPNCHEWVRRWNHTTHLFWKNYAYTRMLEAKVSTTIADAVVKFLTALWHGFRPTYYWMVPEVIMVMHADLALAEAFPLEVSTAAWKRPLYHLWTLLEMTYCCCTFYYSSTRAFFTIRSTLYWIPLGLAFAVFIICKFYKTKRD
jgi:hypothetical protein